MIESSSCGPEPTNTRKAGGSTRVCPVKGGGLRSMLFGLITVPRIRTRCLARSDIDWHLGAEKTGRKAKNEGFVRTEY